MFDDADLSAWMSGDDREREGIAHIASALGKFRKHLIMEGFTSDEAFLLAQDWLDGMIDAGMSSAEQETEE